MNPRRVLVPYLLLGVLTLGAGLGAVLALSEWPVTYTARSTGALAENPCPHSTTNVTIESCRSISYYFDGGPTVPRDEAKCVLKGVVEANPTNVAAFKRDETMLLSTCSGVQSIGTFKHFFENPSAHKGKTAHG